MKVAQVWILLFMVAQIHPLTQIYPMPSIIMRTQSISLLTFTIPICTLVPESLRIMALELPSQTFVLMSHTA